MGFALSAMQLQSVAFQNGGPIPARHTGEGADVSPSLRWSAVPEGTQGFAVLCHDPDAPLIKGGTYGFVHWVLYNLPAATTTLAEGSTEGTAGINDFGKTGYGGPMPPPGHGVHRYYFWIVALNKDMQLPPGLTLWQFLEQAEPHILGINRVVGTYERSS